MTGRRGSTRATTRVAPTAATRCQEGAGDEDSPTRLPARAVVARPLPAGLSGADPTARTTGPPGAGTAPASTGVRPGKVNRWAWCPTTTATGSSRTAPCSWGAWMPIRVTCSRPPPRCYRCPRFRCYLCARSHTAAVSVGVRHSPFYHLCRWQRTPGAPGAVLVCGWRGRTAAGRGAARSWYTGRARLDNWVRRRMPCRACDGRMSAPAALRGESES